MKGEGRGRKGEGDEGQPEWAKAPMGQIRMRKAARDGTMWKSSLPELVGTISTSSHTFPQAPTLELQRRPKFQGPSKSSGLKWTPLPNPCRTTQDTDPSGSPPSEWEREKRLRTFIKYGNVRCAWCSDIAESEQHKSYPHSGLARGRSHSCIWATRPDFGGYGWNGECFE
jgi:hypothetical protein